MVAVIVCNSVVGLKDEGGRGGRRAKAEIPSDSVISGLRKVSCPMFWRESASLLFSSKVRQGQRGYSNEGGALAKSAW